ncbi:MAG: hypothetical protein WCH37_10685, partial [Synechococcaceae cyanobacterium ELA182]
SLGAMELLFSWFNNQYVLMVPLVLLLEELLVARSFSRSSPRPAMTPTTERPKTVTTATE